MKPQVNQQPYLPYIIFDIDGTLANITHRLHYIKSVETIDTTIGKVIMKKPNWEAFNNAMINDEPNKHIVELFHNMCAKSGRPNHPSIFVTGRPESHRDETQDWLMKHRLIPNYLFMRPVKDYRSDVEIKSEIIDKYIMNAPVLFIVDDRDAVVEMWRERGYKCLQCQKGDY